MPRRSRGPRPAHPVHLEVAYWRRLRTQVVAPMARLVNRALGPLVRDFERRRADALEDELETVVAGIRIEFARHVPIDATATREAASAAAAADKFNAVQAKRTVPGLNPAAADAGLRRAQRAFVAENVALIRSIPQEHLARVADKVRAAVSGGIRAEELAEQIKAEHGIADRRARLIARDQISKHHGRLTQTRQMAAGVQRYQWSTSQDDRVRPSHVALNGRVFAWSDPPAVGHPGQDFQCRCVAIPVFEDDELDVGLNGFATQATVEAYVPPAPAVEPTFDHPIVTIHGGDAARQDPGVKQNLVDMDLLDPRAVQLAHQKGVRVEMVSGPMSAQPSVREVTSVFIDAGVYTQQEADFAADRCVGHYDPKDKLVLVSNLQTPEGASTALHEMFHAFDQTVSDTVFSSTPQWTAVYREVVDSGLLERMYPKTKSAYMDPKKGPAELLAELSAVVAKGQDARFPPESRKAFDLVRVFVRPYLRGGRSDGLRHALPVDAPRRDVARFRQHVRWRGHDAR